MLTIKNSKGAFNLRAAAVIARKQEILLLNEPLVGTYWFLPGGRAEMHESTDQTVTRELEEELGGNAQVGPLLWVIENFFTLDHTLRHTIGFYYSASLPKNHPLEHQIEYHSERHEDGERKQFHFRWYSFDEIKDMDIRPKILKEILTEPFSSLHIRHYVSREREP